MARWVTAYWRSRSWWWRSALAGLLAIAVLLTTAGWVAVRGWQARGHLLVAAGLAGDLGGQLLGGDVDRARRTLSALQDRAAAARRATGDVGWTVGQWAPFVGDDLAAVRAVAVTVDELAQQVFPRLLDIDPGLLLPRGGRLDLAGLAAAERQVAAADEVVAAARSRLGRLSVAGLTRPVGTAVTELRTEVDRLATFTGAASRAAALLPGLLGATQARQYLLVSQNLAELRATGGMFGAYAVIRAEQGRVRLVSQGTAGELGHFLPPLSVPEEMRGLYTDLPGIWPADVNLTPHFPTAAALYHEMYRRRTGDTVDGVLATDPVALSYLLAVTGPVQVPGFGQLTSDNAVRSLLSDSYLTLDMDSQDEFFARSAAAVFETLLSASVAPRALLSAFDRSIAESRILFWSARPEEQRTLGESRLTGVLPERESTPTVGVFLNDGSGAKLGYYLRPNATLTVGACRPDGRRDLRLRMSLESAAPTSGLTPSVLGVGRTGDPYVVRTLVNVFSPAGGAVVRARLDGVDTAVGSGTERGRQVAIAAVDVKPGQTRTLEVDLLSSQGGAGGAELRLTPTATAWTTHIQTASPCDQ